MEWIFDPCPDIYGLCIRQYITCAVSFVISIFSIYSVVKTLSSSNKTSKIQLGPLIINFIVTFLIFFLYLAFQEFYNTHLLVIVIEIYSYFLITYAYRILYLKSQPVVDYQKIKKSKIIFLIASFLALIVIIAISIFSFLGLIKCRNQYGLGKIYHYNIIGTLIVFLTQLPVYVLMLILCKKTKKRLNQLAKTKQEIRNSSLRLFAQIDEQIKLKITQTNLVMITFTVTMTLHIIYLLLFLTFDQQMICEKGTNKINVHNFQELLLMIIQNFSELFPYLMIPVIFWFIPEQLSLGSSTQYQILASKGQLSIDEKMNVDIDKQSYLRHRLLKD